MKSLLLTLCAGALSSTLCLAQQAGKPAGAPKHSKATPSAAKPRRPVAVRLTDTTAEKAPARLAVGDTLVLNLTENPTTGYRWAIVAAPAKTRLRPVGDAYVAQPVAAGTVGSGGTRRLRFVAVGAGKAALELHNRREWQKDEPARRLRVAVEVR